VPGGADDFLGEVRAALAAAGDPERATGQQRYMKSAMPFHGVSAPELKRLLRPLLEAYDPVDRAAHEATVRGVWDGATHREERYAALSLARHPRARAWLDLEALPLHRDLVVSGAWWDLVDVVAAHLVGAVLRGHRAETTAVLRGWARDGDPWVRRTAVLAQLGHQQDTDVDLLRDVVEVNAADSSFWLRKAIGWALREYARTEPDWVRAELDRLGDRLSPLSRREAAKHL